MGRRRKTIVDVVRDGTFLARKDEQLLMGRDELPWPTLEEYRTRYQAAAATDPDVAREVSLELQRTLRAPDGSRSLFGDLDVALERLGAYGSFRQLERFAPAFFRHFAGPAARQPFRFERFQRDYLGEFWRRDKHGRRIYNVGLLAIPKGNGKTPLAAVLGTHALVSARDEMAEVYTLAGAKDQADICHTFARNNIERGPLAAWLTVGATISYPEKLGEFEILSSDGDLAHGTNPSAAIVDEWWQFLHRKQREGYNALAKALHKRGGESWLQAITTAGWTKDSQLGEVYDAAVAHPKLEIRNDGYLLVLRDEEAGFLMHWYGAPDDDRLDPSNPGVVRKANPAPWVSAHHIVQDLAKPGADEYDFRRLHLNQWTKAKGAWLPPGAWAALADHGEIPAGADVYVGVDVAESYDTTAVAWAWKRPDGRVVTRCHVWSVRPGAPAHDHVPSYYDADAVHVTEKFILGLAQRYRVREVVADPHRYSAELRRLGLHFQTAPIYPQSKEMTQAVQEFYRDVAAKAIAHDGDRVQAIHVAAIEGRKDSNGDWRIDKLNKPNPIDAGTATIIAFGRCRLALPPTQPFVANW